MNKAFASLGETISSCKINYHQDSFEDFNYFYKKYEYFNFECYYSKEGNYYSGSS